MTPPPARVPQRAAKKGEEISRKRGQSRRYWKLVLGRAEILSKSSLSKGMTRGQIIRVAQGDLKALLNEYAAARKVSYDLFNSKRMKDFFFKGIDPANISAMQTARSKYNQAIREARSDQARLRGEITRATGVGLMSLIGSDETHVQGES
jgi:hypothetical protein